MSTNTCALPRKLPQHTNTTWTTGVKAREDCSSSQLLLPQILHPLCSWAHMSGPDTLVHAPLEL
jgi:hypothetical protein